MKSFLCIAFCSFLVFTGCSSKEKTLTETDKKVVEKAVGEEFNKFLESVGKLDINSWSKFYSEDNFVSAMAGIEYFTSRESWIEAIKAYFAGRQQQVVEPDIVKITALTDELALLVSNEKSKMVSKEGVAEDFTHVFTMVWKKEQAGWKIIHSHESWVKN